MKRGPAPNSRRVPMTEMRKRIFIDTLRKTGVFAAAGRAASPHSKHRTGCYSSFRGEMQRNPDFAAEVAAAISEAKSNISADMIENAEVRAKTIPPAITPSAKRERHRYTERRLKASHDLSKLDNQIIVAKHMVGSTRRNVKKNGYPHSITYSDILPLPTHCPVFGIELTYGGTGRPLSSSATVDRVDNSKGYIPGNVQVISNRANSMKRDATIEDITQLWLYMYKNA